MKKIICGIAFFSVHRWSPVRIPAVIIQHRNAAAREVIQTIRVIVIKVDYKD